MKYKYKIIAKGFLDPRIPDELVLAEIHTNAQFTSDMFENPTCYSWKSRKEYRFFSRFCAKATKPCWGIGCREWIIETEDGKQCSYFSCSGPGPDHPPREYNSKSIRAVVDPLPVIYLKREDIV